MFEKNRNNKQEGHRIWSPSNSKDVQKKDNIITDADSSQSQSTTNGSIRSQITRFFHRNKEQPSTPHNDSSIYESSHEKQARTSAIHSRDAYQINNDTLMDKNQLPSDTGDKQRKQASSNRSHASADDIESINNGSMMNKQQLFDPQNQPTASSTTDNSANVTGDNENQQTSRRRPINTRNNKQESNASPPLAQKLDNTNNPHPLCKFYSDKAWLDPQYHDKKREQIKKPDELQHEMEDPESEIDEKVLDKVQGSMIGMALGDALGAHVEFRPHQYLLAHPVEDLVGGGTWGLKKGQFTDDTSMALCLANSLIARRDFVPYDQLVRYKWWYRLGYMSSTGQCFDIGNATRDSIEEFRKRQKKPVKKFNIPPELIDNLSDGEILNQFDIYCSSEGVAGNGALMRLAPVPLFFYRSPEEAVEFSGISGRITHGDRRAYDACRYYGALIVAALQGYEKNKILDKRFYSKHRKFFGENELHPDIKRIAEGSYQKDGGYNDGIRGKGYIVNALEAALWAFWSDGDSFENGALAAVNLGDDTDTTAAIYGQLAGAYYGYKKLPKQWLKHVYAHEFMKTLSKWIVYEGECWQKRYEQSVTQ